MARGDFPSAKQEQFNLRLPEGMREEIRRLAQEDGRSMNAQIVALLDFSLKNSGLDIDEILRSVTSDRPGAQARAQLKALQAENERLRNRVNLWEPLILQATPEELEKMRDRLIKFQSILAAPDAETALKDIVLPFQDLAANFPSLEAVQRLFEEIRLKKKD